MIMEDQEKPEFTPLQTDDKTDEQSSFDSSSLEQPIDKTEKSSDKTEQPSHKPTLDHSSDSRQPEAKPAERQPKSKREAPLSFKCHADMKEWFRREALNFETQEAFFRHLMDMYENPPVAPAAEVVVEEKTIEVERKLGSGEYLIRLSEQEEKALGLISTNRMVAAGRSNPPGFGAVKAESITEVLRKSFFNQGRLFNLDNTFFTGLSKKDMK